LLAAIDAAAAKRQGRAKRHVCYKVRRELVLVPPTTRESETATVRARDERDTRGTRARRVRGRRVAEAASAKRRQHGKEASGVANDSREEEEGTS
jgi:hypothetical protein